MRNIKQNLLLGWFFIEKHNNVNNTCQENIKKYELGTFAEVTQSSTNTVCVRHVFLQTEGLASPLRTVISSLYLKRTHSFISKY